MRERIPGKGAASHHEAQVATAAHAPGKSTRVPGGELNVDIDRLNRHFDPGEDTARIGDRDAKHHDSFVTQHATHLFDDSGVATGIVPAHADVVINAGAITRLVCKPDKHAVDCVFVFGYWLAGAGGHDEYSSSGGWMKASALPGAVDRDQHALANQIERERGDGRRAFEAGVPITIKTGADGAADGIANLYTYPPPYQVHHENLAVYYYNNLSLNIPHSGGARFGVETDRLSTHPLDPSTLRFYPEHPHQEVSIDLYAQGAHHPSGKKLTFVYGYVTNDAGSKIYGWINKLMLASFT